MNLILDSTKIMYILLIVFLVLIFGLMIAAIIVRVVKVAKLNKKTSGEIDLEQQKIFLEAYGGKDNIVSVNNEMSRVIVEVKDLNLADPQKLKELGATGVLISGNVIKASFQERASFIAELLK